MKRLRQTGDAVALERDHVASVDDFAVEDRRFGVEPDFADVSFVFHHGMTPPSPRNCRSDLMTLDNDTANLVVLAGA